VRVAAAADLHCRAAQHDQVAASFASLRGTADVLLLAGDVTATGDPEQATVLADACSGLGIPVFAVLGNHDWHRDRAADIATILAEAGIVVLDRELGETSATCVLAGTRLGIAGVKGFGGGFAGGRLADFGEPLMRELYAETTADVQALDAGLRAIADCPVRVVVLHYAPTAATLDGEPAGLWPVLGTDRLAGPIAEHKPDLVVHGHAHHGALRGMIGDTPVHNVAVPVMKRDFWLFELDAR